MITAEATDTWIASECMTRLQGVGRTGLLEAVLAATVSRSATAATETFVGKYDVLRTLKQLKEKGRVTYSAGRWYVD